MKRGKLPVGGSFQLCQIVREVHFCEKFACFFQVFLPRKAIDQVMNTVRRKPLAKFKTGPG